MALNSSGPISLAGTTAGVSIEIENGGNGTTQISLNDPAVRSLAGVPSGAITMPTNFWGKSNAFSFSFAGGTNVNLYSTAIANGWNGSSALVATNTGTIQSSSTGTPALTVGGPFPGGVSFINNGPIIGRGGNGGSGGSNGPAAAGPGGAASAGGVGLSTTVPISITNNSIISGGGGGGGGGGGAASSNKSQPSVGGGGGGGGLGVSSGGGGGSGSISGGSPGGSGTISSAAGGGGGGSFTGATGGPGGTGGTYGSTGSNGTGGSGAWASSSGGSGGSAGSCTVGVANITWVSTGTRYGPLN